MAKSTADTDVSGDVETDRTAAEDFLKCFAFDFHRYVDADSLTSSPLAVAALADILGSSVSPQPGQFQIRAFLQIIFTRQNGRQTKGDTVDGFGQLDKSSGRIQFHSAFKTADRVGEIR